ncbi:MAG: TonB-dependent receptor plug domain-containing protein [Bacteroidetes bacterium]|nr:TonB-dependent receptor plug domain-containing protein [Bacteroidota bacterium]
MAQNTPQKASISGYLREKSSGEMLGNVLVAVLPSASRTLSNNYGFYSITLTKGQAQWVYYRFPGFYTDSVYWTAKADTALNIELDAIQLVESMGAVEIRAKKTTIADRADMSRIDIPVQQIKEIPALLGEKDVMKVIQLMPGVQKGGEGQSGIYVRGGGPDQNLIILDEAIVYNASHLFGFFSLFNGDALRSVELVKGGFPSRYAGRLSSVIDMNVKEGNYKKFAGEVGIGVISSRAVFEGPIVKGKSSFMISGRRTYLDALLQPFIMASMDGANVGYYFYDMNAKANYILSNKDKLYVSGYFGRDKFYLNDKRSQTQLKSNFGWGNSTLTGRWNHQFNPKTFANAALIYSHYDLSINILQKEKDTSQFELGYSSTINDYGVKYDVDFRPNPKHMIRAGFSTINHQFSPSAIVLKVGSNFNFNQKIKVINTYESGVYIEDQWREGAWNFYPGLRVSHYVVENKQVLNPEPRLSLAYNIRKDLALKGSYALMNQYIHLLSNTGIGLPTDLWVPATANVKPMQSQQLAVGVAKDFNKGYSLSVEGYYKTMTNVITYREGASFLLGDGFFSPGVSVNNKAWESQVTSGLGWSYGAEVFLQKQVGKLSGWIGYTLSFTQLQFDEVNQGQKYYAKYDRRHDASVVCIYRLNKYFTASATWVYGTGNAITMPQGYLRSSGHYMGSFPEVWDAASGIFNNELIDYGKRNSFRMEAYHRLDLGFQFKKEKVRGIQTWELSFYNAYNRYNPFFYYGQFNDAGTFRTLKKVTLFPMIPSLSWTFKFR